MVDILAFGAHPDDVEFGCGGILAKMAAIGKSIAIVDLTLGDKGTNGTPEVRRQEGEDSAKLINAKRLVLNFKDCEVFDDFEGRLEIVKVLRQIRPKLVLAPLWTGDENHPDHIACGKLVRAACRLSGFSSLLPELETFTIGGVLHYLGPVMQPCDFLIDITEHVSTWKKMMQAHASQMRTFDYLDWNLRRASYLGVMMQVPFAQGLVKGNPVIVDDLMHIGKVAKEL